MRKKQCANLEILPPFNRDGPEWARQRGYIQRLMMHPTAATRYLNWQIPVAQDFVSYISSHRNSDGIVPNLYQDLFKYTMECECLSYSFTLYAFVWVLIPTLLSPCSHWSCVLWRQNRRFWWKPRVRCRAPVWRYIRDFLLLQKLHVCFPLVSVLQNTTVPEIWESCKSHERVSNFQYSVFISPLVS